MFRGRGFSGCFRRRRRTGDATGSPANLARTIVLVAGVGGHAGRTRQRQCGARRTGCFGFGLAKTFLGLEFRLAFGFFVLTMAIFFGLAAGFGSLTFGLLNAFLAVAARGFNFGQLALFDIANLGVRQRAGARGTLILGQRAQHDARAARRRGCGGTGQRRLDRRRLCDHGFGRLRLGCRRVAAKAALAALLDHHLLGTAVAEALAHGARLDARLERQGLGRNTQCLVARCFRINHSAVPILFPSCARSHTRSCKSSVGTNLCQRPSSTRRRIPRAFGRIAGRPVVIRHPVSDQDMAARQERLARRTREQRSMYHI